MPRFSKKSLDKLHTCHPDLVRLFEVIIDYRDCTILEGARLDERQAELYKAGKSKKDGILSKSMHQIYKGFPYSRAIDVTPWPIPNEWGQLDLEDRNNIAYQSRELGEFYNFGGFVQGVAKSLKINIRWGGDWDSDNEFNDQTFFDLPHFELIN